MAYFKMPSFYLLLKVLDIIKAVQGWFFKHILVLRMRVTSSAFSVAVHVSNSKCTLAHLDFCEHSSIFTEVSVNFYITFDKALDKALHIHTWEINVY